MIILKCDVIMCPWWCRCHRRARITTNSTLSFWGIRAANLTLFKPMCMLMAWGTGNRGWTSGLTQPRTFTPIPSSGTVDKSCKQSSLAHVLWSLLDNVGVDHFCFWMFVSGMGSLATKQSKTEKNRAKQNKFRFHEKRGIEFRAFWWFFVSLWILVSFLVDETPIRVHSNLEHRGIPFPKDQAMGVYSSIWNADDWATQGGRVKTNWAHAPFIASYKGFEIDGCECPTTVATADVARKCSSDGEKKYWWDEPTMSELNLHQSHQLVWVRARHMVYDYCTDSARFPVTPAECVHHSHRHWWWKKWDSSAYEEETCAPCFAFEFYDGHNVIWSNDGLMYEMISIFLSLWGPDDHETRRIFTFGKVLGDMM